MKIRTIAKNAKISNYLTVALLTLSILQGYISNPPLTAEDVKFLSPILLLVVLIIGQVKNVFAPDVNSNQAKWPIIIVGAIAIIGGLNDYFFQIITFTERTEQILRLILTFLSAVLTALSKSFFPTAISLTEKNYRA